MQQVVCSAAAYDVAWRDEAMLVRPSFRIVSAMQDVTHVGATVSCALQGSPEGDDVQGRAGGLKLDAPQLARMNSVMHNN